MEQGGHPLRFACRKDAKEIDDGQSITDDSSIDRAVGVPRQWRIWHWLIGASSANH
jgi:hypothetical protein